jgi:carboxylesterase
MRHIRITTAALASLLALSSACTAIEYEDDWMDSPTTEDPSIADPASFLVSERGEPTEEEKDMPVIVLVHGWSGSTYAFTEFADYATERGALVSNVLLAGHGRSTDAFIETDVDEYAAPVVAEHARLSELGYRNINFALSLAASAMFVRLLEQGALDGLTPPQNVAFLSPNIVMADKRLYAVDAIGPVINNLPGKLSEEEKRLWYTNRPHQAMHELAVLLVDAEHALRDGEATLPEGTRAHIWVAENDPISDPVGFDLLQDHLIADDVIGRTTVDSELQTFWRGIGRPRSPEGELHVWTDEDQNLAETCWGRFYAFLTGDEV